MLNSIKSKLAALRAAPTDISGLLDRIDELREQIADIHAQRDLIAHAPRPAADILAALDIWFDQAATDAVDAIHVNRLLNRSVPVALELPFYLDPQTRQVDASRATKAVADRRQSPGNPGIAGGSDQRPVPWPPGFDRSRSGRSARCAGG